MSAYSITSVTGWILLALLLATAVYPFLLRSGLLGPVQPFLKRMRFHYWAGYSIAIVVLVHLWIPMSAGLAGKVSATCAWRGNRERLCTDRAIYDGGRLPSLLYDSSRDEFDYCGAMRRDARNRPKVPPTIECQDQRACHSERSEESQEATRGFFAALRMTGEIISDPDNW
jgi:hypothetical protein